MSSILPKIESCNKILEEAFNRFDKVGVGFSGGSDSVVVLSMSLRFNLDLPVLFVNTYHQFRETYSYIEYMEKRWNLNLFRIKVKKDKYSYYREKYGDTPKFYEKCCLNNKIKPLLEGINYLKLDALVVGIRGVEHEERSKEIPFSPRDNPPHYRIHPILDWTRQDVIDYFLINNIPHNPMYDKGYTSLGCKHCTKPNPLHKHERSGRARKREVIMKKLREEGYT